ncbi:MAG: ATP-binding protein [Acidobacteria bacterium]|nr:ATP-binding protein [Acidobacteriota bacterium]
MPTPRSGFSGRTGGLAISKKIVEQLGGTIEVASEVGLETTFTLRFSLTKARPSQLAAV